MSPVIPPPIVPLNSADPTTLLVNLRQLLIAAGIGRDPRVPGDDRGNPAPIWIEPRNGVPYPGQKEDLGPGEGSLDSVVALNYATEIPSQPYEGFLDRPHVTIWYRTRIAPTAKALHKQVKDLLHDQRNYSLNGLAVNESMMFRGLQPLGSDSVGYTFNSEWEFTLWSD